MTQDPPARGLRGLLRAPDFARLTLAHFASSLGDWLLITVLPFYTYEKYGSTSATAAVLIASTAPRLLFGPLAGAAVDRWDKKTTMIAADAFRGLLLLLVVFADSSPNLIVLLVVVFAEATASQFFIPARLAVNAFITDRDELVAANSIISATESTAQLAGPALGGVILAAGGVGAAFAADAATYALSAVALFLTKIPRADATEAAPVHDRLWRATLDGLRFIRHTPVGGVFLVIAGTMLFQGMISILLVPFLTGVADVKASHYGLLLAVGGAGGLAGSILTGAFAAKLQSRNTLGLALIATSLTFGLLTRTTDLTKLFPLIFVSAGLGAVAVIAARAQIQGGTDLKLQGRVFGSFAATVTVGVTLGTALAPGLEAWTGTRAGLLLAAGGMAATGAGALLWTGRTRPPSRAMAPSALGATSDGG